MNKTEAADRIAELAEAAKSMKLEVGNPCSVSFVADSGDRIGAARIAGRIRFSVNGVYTSKAKALEVLE